MQILSGLWGHFSSSSFAFLVLAACHATQAAETPFVGPPAPAKTAAPVAAQPEPFKGRSSKRIRPRTGGDFVYISKLERIQALEELAIFVMNSYALVEQKLAVLKVDVEATIDEAIKIEAAIDDVPADDFDTQAEQNLAFYDRMRLLAAKFQDTHFQLLPTGPYSRVNLGFFAAKIEGKYRVTHVIPKLLAYSGGGIEKITTGDELISIDGVAADDLKNDLQKYIASSSRVSADVDAQVSLTARVFRLPKEGYSVVRIKKADGRERSYRMNWFHSRTERGDLRRHFSKPGFQETDKLGMNYDDNKKEWQRVRIQAEGLDLNVENLFDKKTYGSSDGDALTTGILITKGKSVQYIKLRIFVSDVKSGAESHNLIEVIRESVKAAKELGLPVLFDLRDNMGGEGQLPAQLLSLVTEKDKTYLGPTAAFPLGSGTLSRMLSTNESELAQEIKGADVALRIAEIRKAWQRKESISPVFSDDLIRADEEVKGFENPVAVWASSECVSACDKFVMLFKTSGRGKVFGEATNGTGAGNVFSEGEGESWIDSSLILKARVPNYLFGRPLEESKDGQMVRYNAALAVNIENKPAEPDVKVDEPWASYEKKSPLKHIEETWKVLFGETQKDESKEKKK